MKFLSLSLIFALAVMCVKAQTKSEITIGKIDSLYSPTLKEYRKISIHTPKEYNASDTTKWYPVIYLLDGNAHFYSMVAILHQLGAKSDVSPKSIVVAIHNTDRIRDLSPTHIEMKMGSTSFATSGGGDQFMNFITHELIPYVEKNYKTNPQRMLSGHSLGGLMVVHAMVHYTNYFSRYIAYDPSLWWDDQKLLKQYEQSIKTKPYWGKSLFIGIANTIGMDTAKAIADTARRMQHFKSILELSRFIKKNKNSGLDFAYQYYENETHGTIPLICQYDAMRFFYRKKPIQMKEDALKVYTGTYKASRGTNKVFDISTGENALLIKDRASGKKFKFVPVSEVEFYSADENVPLQFVKDEKGNVSQVLGFNADIWHKVVSQ